MGAGGGAALRNMHVAQKGVRLALGGAVFCLLHFVPGVSKSQGVILDLMCKQNKNYAGFSCPSIYCPDASLMLYMRSQKNCSAQMLHS